jgi:recombinational DNA repair protein (RecF pathway)
MMTTSDKEILKTTMLGFGSDKMNCANCNKDVSKVSYTLYGSELCWECWVDFRG